MKQILSCACLVVIVTAATVLFVVALPLAALAEQNLSLDGTWRFSFQGGEERDMPVPSCWELQGVGTLRYGEADAKESGRYSRTFAIPSSWLSDDLVILRFDGVMFGAQVMVNGKYAGLFRSSFNRNELDITALVRRDAENDLVVETLKNPKGWGFDCNDDWVLHGIFRSVTLISRPRLNVADILKMLRRFTSLPKRRSGIGLHAPRRGRSKLT